jgi:hypothetical protein
MAVEVELQPETGAPMQSVAEEPKPIMEFELNARRTMDGDVMVFDHADIDIIIMPNKGKVLSLAKDLMTEVVYGASNRLCSYLSKRGIVDPSSVQGGNVYGSLEATLLQPINLKLILLNISKWVDSERPYFEFVDNFEDTVDEYYTDPSDEDSTKLGEVPHEVSKGTLQPGYNYGPYFQNYVMEQKQRED